MERAALVTGAAGGIGRAIAARLEADGYGVLAVDLEPDADGPGVPFAADLATREGNRDAVAAALERFGRLDLVVPNAGFQHVAPVAEFDEDRWDGLLAILLDQPVPARQARLARARRVGRRPHRRRRLRPRARRLPFKAGYVSAKHGVLGLVKTLALEGAEHGILATAVCPGYVRTPLVERQIADQAARARPPGGARARRGHPRARSPSSA